MKDLEKEAFTSKELTVSLGGRPSGSGVVWDVSHSFLKLCLGLLEKFHDLVMRLPDSQGQ